MTINIADNSPRISYTVAQGVTQTSFAVPFEFFDNADLNVYIDGTLKTITTHYTVSGGDGSTGTVSMSVTGGTGGSIVVITRDIELERTTDFPVSGAFNIVALNTELDRLIAVAADLDDRAARSIQAQDFDTTVTYTLPVVNDRKGKVLGFNASTGAVEAGPQIADVQSLANISADIATLADIEDGTDATDAIQNVNTIRANVTTVAGVASNVTTVAGISSNVTSVAGNATNINTVASNIASVNTVATNITSVVAVANDLVEAVSEVETVANDLNEAVSEIDTVATNIANVNTVGGISANVTTVAGISANVTTVAGISANVTTVAGNNANVTTVAGQTTNLQNVTDNLTAIQNAAGNANSAATSATAAAASQTAAASSATAAAASQTAAAASAASAATSYDSFDDRYLGVKNSDPTTDNDGDALASGMLYFSSSENIMKVYDGASWIAATSAGNVSLTTFQYTATGGQTTFSGSDDNSATLSYTVNNILVTLNGSLLFNGTDYTATNGTSVVLASGAVASDVLQVTAFKSFTTADMVPASTGGTFAGNVAVTGDFTVDTSTLKVDSSNNRVGIGTASPSDLLELSGDTAQPAIRLTDADVSGLYHRIFTPTNTGLAISADTGNVAANSFVRFDVDGSEAMRIDSSGNLLVGVTSMTASDTSGTGMMYANGVALRVKRESSGGGQPILDLNNTGSDDVMAMFRKDGVTVGSIGTANSGDLYIGNDDTTLLFAGGSDMIIPRGTAGATRSGAIDLGASSHAFKSLYLAGTIGANSSTAFTSMDGRLMFDNDYSSSALGPNKVVLQAEGNWVGGLGISNNFLDIYTGGGIRFNKSASQTSYSAPMTLDASGTLLVGKTTDTQNDAGHVMFSNGAAYATRSGGFTYLLNRTSSNGELLRFQQASTTVGGIGVSSSYIWVNSGNVGLAFYPPADSVYPVDSSGNNRDNATDLGTSSVRFDDIYATNGTIQTSDRNEKQDIEELTDAEQRVAVAAKGLLRKFRWRDAVTEKGDEARTHFGIIAQDLQAAFAAEGLDASNYAMFISTTWWETQTEVAAVEAVEAQDAVYNEDGELVTEAVEAVEAKEAYTRIDTYNSEEEAPEGATERTRMGVRYSELLAFIIAAI